MKFSDKAIELLAYLDFFQQNVSLKLNGCYRISLLQGKLFSIGIMVFLLYNVLTSDMMNKINPTVQQSYIDSEIPEIILTKENFRYFISSH